MPPSGYSQQQAELVSRFLESCADALKCETLAAGHTMLDALRAECNDIRAQLANGSEDAYGKAVLQLTLVFYEGVAECSPADAEQYEASVQAAVRDVREAVLGIHIA